MELEVKEKNDSVVKITIKTLLKALFKCNAITTPFRCCCEIL